ncbi:MAG: twin-arginine translocase TatA/TatE family subunit [Chloracidobacterium sp.]|nr:twin-arginine translocase TatA/TatE family subunit [Chloracidobacterium sp.]MDW8218811.1 twin-arginine translocase TatA/TatE family subunit [Acidobacteriota bacterium]
MFGIGTPELIFIFLVGFFIFGPRQLPDIGRRLGEIMAQLRRAADEFKQTWEAEVESERARLAKTLSSAAVDLELTPTKPVEAELPTPEGTLPRTPWRPQATDAAPDALGGFMAPDAPRPSSPPNSSPSPDAAMVSALQTKRPVASSVETVGYEG